MMITNEKPMSDNTMSLIDKLHDEFHGNGGYDEKMKAVYKESYVTGKSASMDDISETVTAEFRVIEVVVVILLIILLFLILKCYITPIRAILNILMSVIWTIALTHVVFGTLLDIPVCWIVPIVLFVVLLGLVEVDLVALHLRVVAVVCVNLALPLVPVDEPRERRLLLEGPCPLGSSYPA